MKDQIFGVLQKIGRSFMLPIAVLPVAGLFLGVGGSFSNETMISLYHLESILGAGTILGNFMLLLNDAGSAIFNNLALLFAIAVAIGMSNREKATGALAAVIGFLIMNAVIARFLIITNSFDTSSLTTYNNNLLLSQIADGTITNVNDFVPLKITDPSIHQLPNGATTSLLGYTTLSTGVFGGIIVGLVAAWANNKFYNCQLPPVISFFSGTRSVPIVTAVCALVLGVVMYYVWPYIQIGLSYLSNLVDASGYIGTFIYGYIERALIPFGLHHVFYLPFWQTALGGTITVNGVEISGAQNIYFELLREGKIDDSIVNYTRFFAGKFPFMIFGLPGAALAMYQTAYEEKKKIAGGLLLSAALTAMLTGITEPIEFTFIFVAPALYYGVHCVLAGLSFMLMHMFGVGVGMTFSGGLIDLFLFGILQGMKTHWYWVVVVGVVYFFIYWFLFKWIIVKFNLATPGREEDDQEVKLYTRADVNAQKAGASSASGGPVDMKSAMILKGLGGKDNLDGEVDCCITRLRLDVKDPSKVDEDLLKATGAVGVVSKGKGLQVIYGPTVPSVKNNLVEFLETPEADHVDEIVGDAGQVTEEAQATNVDSEAAFTELFQTPIVGRVADISETPDEAFSQKMLGDGIVVFPTGNKVYAPCDGTIEVLFPTYHAIGMTSDKGVELLIHVGIDTVNLEGKGFTPKIEQGQKVKAGQEMLELDLDYIKANAPSTAVPMLFTALPADQKVKILKTGDATLDEDVVEVTNQD